ncbi:F170A protein, partial [Crocuta crocuta]
GISKSPTNDLPPEYFLEDTPLLSEAKHASSELEYLSSNSSFYRRSCAGKEKGRALQVSALRACHQEITCLGFHDNLESSPPFPPASFPFHPIGNPKPSLSSEHPKGERLMRIFYLRVHRKRGVAVLCEGKNGLEPASKKRKMEELTISEISSPKTDLSCPYTEELLTDSDSSWNNEAQEERQEVESPTELPPLEGCSMAKPPEWLLAPESGFKCMACCRVFPTLEALKQHVQNGVSEG